MRQFLPLVSCVLALVSGCASTVSVDSLKAPADRTPITFAHDFMYDYSHQPDLPQPDAGAVRGVLAGTYVPEFEDAGGVYYRGVGTCVVVLSSPEKSHKRYLEEGGVWIEKNTAHPKFRLYRVLAVATQRSVPFDGDLASSGVCGTPVASPAAVAGTGAAAAGATRQAQGVVVAPPGATALQAGVGGGIANALVASIIASDRGKLAFLPQPPDDVRIDGAYSRP
jgi:hypothetical protein